MPTWSRRRPRTGWAARWGWGRGWAWGSARTSFGPGCARGLRRSSAALGLATALCWAISPIFIRHGLRAVPSPLIGVTVGLAASAAAYGGGLWVRQRRTPPRVSREALQFKL